MNDMRHKIATLARGLYSGGVSFEEFMDSVPEMGSDELIDELVDLIEHEPKKGGLFGASEKEHSRYIQRIFATIEKLEQAT
jgi:hypothetical protein